MTHILQNLEDNIVDVASDLEAKYESEDDIWDVDDIIEEAIRIVDDVASGATTARKYKRKYKEVFKQNK
jgi:hypothetical protein